MTLSPQKLLEFQECLHDLQIHAGLGVTENNIDKVQLLTEKLNDIGIELYYQAFPEKNPHLVEEAIAPAPKLHPKQKKQ